MPVCVNGEDDKVASIPISSSACNADDSLVNEKALQETRIVVNTYLRRSLSQSARSSTNHLKPEGLYVVPVAFF